MKTIGEATVNAQEFSNDTVIDGPATEPLRLLKYVEYTGFLVVRA